MVTDAMIEAGGAVHARFLGLPRKANPKIDRELYGGIYGAMHAARPTVDLGEDGELVARVERFAAELPAGDSVRLPSGNTLYGDDLRDLLRRAVLSRGGN